ncbi:predicted protein [Scheffersomyces stipitis CBS 6054]|uniref:F-box domain-containing protein n=1 Tax=Scheffersomyces stipitis (strain ATCC 58785 / CBS 6054 / NBRC 10063 / NRRL Y-11545) TaxID=322104 RepID=A3LR16_PICST|nr:predicted protein [Scheffersomyces stipitis CBS 6054]ABN65307.2 predicted protein [Scheffersomyces stipitis CBS 6054]
MVSILNLPHEVMVKVFKYLTPSETSQMIKKLKSDKEHRGRLDDLVIRLLYQRLFNGKLMIINDKSNETIEYDTMLTIDSFEERFLVHNYENLLFQEIRPNYVEVKFTRQANDYMNFIGNLYKFFSLLSREENVQMLKYFETKILQLDFYTDGNLVLIENPTSLSTIIIKILISLSSNKDLLGKIKRFTIKSTDIGNLYVSQWSQLFRRFINLHTLDLSNDIIHSDYDDCRDVLGYSFKFPARLKILVLDNNVLRYVSVAMIASLPHSLEVLSLSHNKIVSVEPVRLSSKLPNLRYLNLDYNGRLSFLDPVIFRGIRRDFRLSLRGTSFEDADFSHLARATSEIGFTIIV